MTVNLNWHQQNQHFLLAALEQVRTALERHGTPPPTETAAQTNRTAPCSRLEFDLNLSRSVLNAALPPRSALAQICNRFGLSPFERDVLLLCAGMELDATFAALCAAAQGNPQRDYPTFSLALAALPNSHWSALTPDAPLRRWRLVEIGNSNTLAFSPLRINERILHHLVGLPYLDDRLGWIAEPVTVTAELVPSQQTLADQIAALWWEQAKVATETAVIQLCGSDAFNKRAIALAICQQVGLSLYTIPAALLPANPSEITQLMQWWEREAILSDRALLLDCDEVDLSDRARDSMINCWLEESRTPVIVSSRDRRQSHHRPLVTYDIKPLTTSEQRAVWQNVLGNTAADLNGHLDLLVSQFNLNVPTIHAVCAGVLKRHAPNPSPPASASPASHPLTLALWNTCRTQARPKLDDLAQRIESVATWEDLILPEAQKQILRDVAIHVRQRTQVYENWGFANKGGRGLGISALFAGGSGTGKTMAAEVLANELNLDVYRIDLSCVVSKYIGETEKNLGRVFDAAEAGGAILLFDEADALFGKRSDVKDSHDRYANIEVGYLLQRMESYKGLAILTTNLKDAIDAAFLRRIRFTIRFPFPDANQRAEIWRHVFPKQMPTANLNIERLAQLNIAGGNIRNIAVNAAFFAAEAREPVGMPHLLRAARSEYLKLEKTLTDSEIKGW